MCSSKRMPEHAKIKKYLELSLRKADLAAEAAMIL